MIAQRCTHSLLLQLYYYYTSHLLMLTRPAGPADDALDLPLFPGRHRLLLLLFSRARWQWQWQRWVEAVLHRAVARREGHGEPVAGGDRDGHQPPRQHRLHQVQRVAGALGRMDQCAVTPDRAIPRPDCQLCHFAVPSQVTFLLL